MQSSKDSRTLTSTTRKQATQMCILFVSVRINTTFYNMCPPLIITVLNPNYKLAYVKEQWDSQDVADGRDHLETVVSIFQTHYCPWAYILLQFDEYYKPQTQMPINEPALAAPRTRPLLENWYSDAWMHEAIKAHQAADQLACNPHQELTLYLSLP
jgi:hypothetical protein